ncbi:MAG TPA: FAD-dependent oxidoreductase [Propionicimonas sp.]|nr:FAD-dependent oxidoreductase [Propionicimonas sp.]
MPSPAEPRVAMETVRTDLVIVGAGAAALLAAVAARRLGQEVLVVEASPLAGGSTAVGDGRMWLPGNPLAGKLGATDTPEAAAEYLDAVLGAPTAASTAARRAAFVETAPKLARWLISSRLPLAAVKGLPDFHSEAAGARQQGRVLASQHVDRRSLGEWTDLLRRPQEGGRRPFGDRVLDGLTRRSGSTTPGESLAAALLRRATATGVEVWLDSPATGLVHDADGVHGVVVEHLGATVEVRAAAVLLANGGFEASQELREEYLPLPTDAAWTVTGVPNTGSLLAAAKAAGAATAALEDAWWQPVMLTDGVAYPLTRARAMPHGLIVDQAGDRFVNEVAPGVLLGRHLYERSRGVRAIPSFLIVDNRHRQHYPLGPWAPGAVPKRALEAGEIVKANTLNDLAEALGVDRAGLLGTVVRFNSFATSGRDLDFGRGRSAWDKARGNAGKQRNPSLGKVEKSPFWAVRVYPGDEGTKGGLLVDADAAVLDEAGAVIPGLFACGGAAASLMGRTSPAPGAALGAALVEAFRAVTRDQPQG